ncbi:hypothetical protein CBP31_03005 [Oceanisphaera profunda]|uniref:Replication gene A protein-like domain-containing protein n=1 Tax=Oceanisphaera profunda TaxID=1416627 RepID=A0A1Y0D2G6_9GAMM|nr:replication endonuclease [Oceanisphaera profunda]ART81720.1 hypothetical protein CBP31_03005 [Oceanisphaera profunda]
MDKHVVSLISISKELEVTQKKTKDDEYEKVANEIKEYKGSLEYKMSFNTIFYAPPVSYFLDEKVKEKDIKAMGRAIGNRILELLIECAGNAEKFDEELSSLLRQDLKNHFPNFIKVKKTTKKEKILNEKTGRMKTYKERTYTKEIRKDLVLDFCKSTRVSNSYFRYSKKCVLHAEQQNKEVGEHNKYVGELSLKRREEQLENGESFLKSKSIITNGKKLTLSEIKKTASHKFNELYIEIKGYENIAKEKGMTWLFITITAPANFHPNPSKGKNSNKGESASDAKRWRDKKWGNLRKQLQKEGFKDLRFGINSGFGFTVIEPHKDGCPHWHILLFCKKELKERYKEIFNFYFLHSGNSSSIKIIESGYDENGEELKGNKVASAASYLSKYIMKHVGLDSIKELTTTNNLGVKEKGINILALKAVDAWKSSLNVRSFQTFGVSGIKTIYRVIREIKNAENNGFKEREFQKSKFIKKTHTHKEIKIKQELLALIHDDEFNISDEEEDEVSYMTFKEAKEVFENKSKRVRDAINYHVNQMNRYDEIELIATRMEEDKEGNLKNNIDYADFIKKIEFIDIENAYEEKEDEGGVKKSIIGLNVGFMLIKKRKFKIYSE